MNKSLLIFAQTIFLVYRRDISMIERAKTEEKNTSRDEAQWTIYEAIVKWKTKVSEFKWHSHDKVTKLIEMIIIKDELVRNTRYAEKNSYHLVPTRHIQDVQVCISSMKEINNTDSNVSFQP